MFRIVCFVEDKNLSKVLHATAGLVVNMEPPQPVTNAVIVKPGKSKVAEIKQASPATSIKGRFTEYLATIKEARVGIDELRKKWVETGGLPTSLNGSLLIQLIEEKHVRRIARGQYLIT